MSKVHLTIQGTTNLTKITSRYEAFTQESKVMKYYKAKFNLKVSLVTIAQAAAACPKRSSNNSPHNTLANVHMFQLVLNQDSSTSSVSFASSTSPRYLRADINEHPDTCSTIAENKRTYKFFDNIIDHMYRQDMTPTSIDIALGAFINEDVAQNMEEEHSGDEDHQDDNHE